MLFKKGITYLFEEEDDYEDSYLHFIFVPIKDVDLTFIADKYNKQPLMDKDIKELEEVYVKEMETAISNHPDLVKIENWKSYCPGVIGRLPTFGPREYKFR